MKLTGRLMMIFGFGMFLFSCPGPISEWYCDENDDCELGYLCNLDGECIECESDELCYEAEGGVCLAGVRECADGILSDACATGDLSTTTEHCGPECGECPEGADGCQAGECRCGSSEPCTGQNTCCGTGCFDLLAAQDHCGACDVDCGDMLDIVGPYCDQGLCMYEECADGFLDCDGNESNGCETPSDMTNCAGCGDRCEEVDVYLHTESQECTAGACTFACVPGYDSCDDDDANGCETSLTTTSDCGLCRESCINNRRGFACLEQPLGDYTHACGCLDQTDCPPDRMCKDKEKRCMSEP